MHWLNCSRRVIRVFLVLLIPGFLTGCSVKRMVSGAVEDLTSALYRQRDPQLAREGAASFLLAVDSMIGRNPDDPELLLRGVQTYSAYAGAFTLGTDPDRAFILYDQALVYGLRLWKTRFGWHDIRRMDLDRWNRMLETCGLETVPDLYWTANAWAGWIAVNPESTLATADLSYVVAAMNRVLALDPGYQKGAAHLFFGTYYAVQPRGMGRDLEKSRSHFETAIRLGGPYAMLPRVLYARYYARARFDETLFRTTLEEVLRSPSRCPDPNLNLQNAIARERARVYLEQVEELF